MSDIELIKVCLNNAPCGTDKKQVAKLLNAVVKNFTCSNSSQKQWNRLVIDYQGVPVGQTVHYCHHGARFGVY